MNAIAVPNEFKSEKKMTRNLTGKVAVVTSESKGIGAAIVGAGGNTIAVGGDIASQSEVDRLYDPKKFNSIILEMV